MKRKYPVNRYLGVPVTTDPNGNYVVRFGPSHHLKLNWWRTGRHTKGRFKRVGQVFLTENRLRFAIVSYVPVKYRRRHRYVSLARFLPVFVSPELLKIAKQKGLNP